MNKKDKSDECTLEDVQVVREALFELFEKIGIDNEEEKRELYIACMSPINRINICSRDKNKLLTIADACRDTHPDVKRILAHELCPEHLKDKKNYRLIIDDGENLTENGHKILENSKSKSEEEVLKHPISVLVFYDLNKTKDFKIMGYFPSLVI